MTRTLRRGDRGQDVRAVQQGLNMQTPDGAAPLDDDGVFGGDTDTAVRRFQDDNGLEVDGIVGPTTRVAIFPLATVTMRLVGMRLRQPSLLPPRPSPFPNLLPGRLTLGDAPSDPALPTDPPSPPPSLNYSPVRYPRLQIPVATPSLTPFSFPNISLPVHHFEIAPGATGFLLPRGRGIDMSFGLSLSGIVMIGDEKLTHNEFSSGFLLGTPGIGSGGDWTVAWFSQITHVHQLNRAGNFSWQPNAQIGIGNSSTLPFLSLTASPAVVQYDANDNISISLGGPNIGVTMDPNAATLSVGLFSFGVVGKFN